MLPNSASLLGSASQVAPHQDQLHATLANQHGERDASPGPSDWQADLISDKEIIRGWWYSNALFFPYGTIICSMSSREFWLLSTIHLRAIPPENRRMSSRWPGIKFMLAEEPRGGHS